MGFGSARASEALWGGSFKQTPHAPRQPIHPEAVPCRERVESRSSDL